MEAWRLSLAATGQRGRNWIILAVEEHLSVTGGSPPTKPQMGFGHRRPLSFSPLSLMLFFFFYLNHFPPYSLTLHVWHSLGVAGWCWSGRVQKGKRYSNSLVGWPAVYQLCASGTLSSVEKGLLSPTRTHSLSPFTSSNRGPPKSGRQILLKPSLILIYACGLLLHTPTQTHLFQVMCTELFFLVFHCF